jgi:hypothetical protein
MSQIAKSRTEKIVESLILQRQAQKKEIDDYLKNADSVTKKAWEECQRQSQIQNIVRIMNIDISAMEK